MLKATTSRAGLPLVGGLSVLVAVVGVPSLERRAAAQEEQVKPYVMMLFDTSGSMSGNVCGGGLTDNSAECLGSDVSCTGAGSCNTYGCGNGIADDSRIYKVKKGAYNVVSAFGEVTFAASRFHQVPGNFSCNTGNGVGGWRGAPNACNNNAVGTGWTQADVLVGFSDTNQMQILRWLNHCKDSPIGTCGIPPNPATTGCTLCADCGGGCDYELRAEGYTPLAGSMYDLRVNHFNGATGVIATDTKASCRPYKLILLTDGQDNCPGDPVQEATNLYTNPSKSIPVHVIGFASAGLKPYLDQIAAGGGTTQAVVVDNEVSLALAMANIISESLLKEKCNGIDDDCDTKCDEDWPEVAVTGAPCTNKHAAQTCTAGVGICQRTGVYVCNAAQTGSQCSVTPGPPNPGGEICGNGLDDDCDGVVDEGCVPCVPQPEVCDGKDNNCDGQIDEGYVSVPCGSSIGECKQGTTACVAGKVVCNGASPPTAEICDGLDNNCDTIKDNFSEACYPAASGCTLATGLCKGVCKIGSRLCTAGSWSACQGYQGPTAEVCNGLDDDCDGVVDNGVTYTCMDYSTCKTYTSCSACPAKPVEICDGIDNDCNGQIDDNPLLVGQACGAAVGECTKGKWVCVAGKLDCQGGVKPTPESCDGKDNDCNGIIDDNVPGLGGACGSSVGECKPGSEKCVGGKVTCVGDVKPTPEVCDGKDNDCSGTADDNIPSSPCGSDVGECKAGATACIAGQTQCMGGVGPAPEICDGKDNNCDGVVDNSVTDEGKACGSSVGECKPGSEKCLAGKLVCIGGVGPTSEVCDGKDNDCDGTVDNNIAGVGTVCGNNVGECKQGTMGCAQTPAGGWALVCVGGVMATNEVCDGKDNDCDGQTDEDHPEKGKTCGTNVGECKAGTYVCASGKLDCQGAVGGTPEICDGKDNDCNGKIDDSVPGEGQPCWPAGYTPPAACQGKGSCGECKQGQTKCTNAAFICVGGVGPTTEICDGKDNNCDGVVDENAECPGGAQCLEGQCLVPCKGVEFSCPGGTKCVNDYCVPDKCATAKCKPTERCVDGDCLEKCAGVSCGEHEKCEPTKGTCVDDSCVSKGCPTGQACVGYACIEDPCPPGKCPEGQQCSAGVCTETCLNITCPKGQVCSKGQCITNPCEGYPCEGNYVCKVVEGKPGCEPDPCRIISCNKGEACFGGQCVPDPCATTRCPEGTHCEVNTLGEADCKATAGAVPTTRQLLATGGGGCACEVGGGGRGAEGLLLLPILLGLWLAGTRQRRHRRRQ